MPGYIEDKWLKKRPDKDTGKRTRTALWGRGLRYRVKGIPGVRDRSFDTVADAKRWLAQTQTDSQRGDFVDERDGTITLQDYVEDHWWPTQAHSPQTRESMRYRIWGQVLPHIGHVPLREIGTAELRRWSSSVQQEVGATTSHLAWVYLKAIMQAAVEDKRILRNPCTGSRTVKPPKKSERRARSWPQSRIHSVRESLPARYRVAVDLGFGAGLRQGEAFALTPSNVHDASVVVSRQIVRYESQLYFAPPKGRKEREVPIPTGLAKRIIEHRTAFPPVEVTLPWLDPDGPDVPRAQRRLVTLPLILYSTRLSALNRATWNTKTWKPALAKAGVIAPLPKPAAGEPVTRVWEPSREHGFHVLRHTYASVMLEAGESVVSLAKWLGHSDPAFTLRTYTHFMPEAGSRGVRSLESWFDEAPASP